MKINSNLKTKKKPNRFEQMNKRFIDYIEKINIKKKFCISMLFFYLFCLMLIRRWERSKKCSEISFIEYKFMNNYA